MMSSSTTAFGARSAVPDCRRTRGLAWPMIARLSRVFFARNSWMMPIPLLAMMSRPNRPLISEPVANTMASSTPRIALIRVKTLARTISATLREARLGTSLVLPAATRAATSASESPAAIATVIAIVSPHASGSSRQGSHRAAIEHLNRELYRAAGSHSRHH